MWIASLGLWIPGVFQFCSHLRLQHLPGFEQVDICWMRYNFELSPAWDFPYHFSLLSKCLILDLWITQCSVRSARLNYTASGIPVGEEVQGDFTGLHFLTDFCDFRGFPWRMAGIRLSESGRKAGKRKLSSVGWGGKRWRTGGSLPKSFTAPKEIAPGKGEGGWWLEAREGIVRGWQMECSLWGLSKDQPLQSYTMYRSKSNWGTCALKGKDGRGKRAHSREGTQRVGWGLPRSLKKRVHS